MRPLNASVLADPPTGLAVPAYDRNSLAVGVVHFGVGGFHRAHQAMYLDRLMSDGLASDWAICGVGVLPQDERMRDVLDAQDGLYVLMEKHADGSRQARVVGSIVEYLFAPEDPDRVVRRLSDPNVRVVSLTITEGGYPIDPATGELVDVQANHPSVFGLIVEALGRRREIGTAPFAVLSCDNIQHNGSVARRSCVGYARGVDAELAEWIDAQVAFPDSMVDRITPVTTDADRAEVAERFGIVDEWPVVCEAFQQWVIEDRFPAGRPPYEDVGVQLVTDVEPYELMKLRLLNSSHQAMCYLGYLSGYRYAHEAMDDPKIRGLLADYMEREGGPTVPDVPGVDLVAYQATLIERFANPEIKDTLARLCAESSDRIPKWLLPVVRENLARGRDVARSAAVVASWARYAEGVDERGEPITVVDQLASQLVPVARRQRESPTAFIEQRELFGDLVDDERFTRPYLSALATLHAEGAQALLASLTAGD
jgi:mannitol 2-dehydrogenase